MKLTVHISKLRAEALDPRFFGVADALRKTCIISINEPGKEPAKLKDGWDDKLVVHFWDITKRIANTRQVDQWLEPISEDQAKEIADFIKAHNEDHIVVHCHAGISRSAAVVRLLTELGWQFDFSQSYHDLAGYNILVYSMVKKHFSQLLPIGV